MNRIRGREVGVEVSVRAVWKNLEEFGAGKSILYPTGLLALLK
jgi:hypothetical protein